MDEVSLDANRTQADEEDAPNGEQDRPNQTIPWTEFTEDFHMQTPDFDTIKGICEANSDKLIDLRPYSETRPYTVFQKDSLRKVVDLFRMMNLRHLPVLDERRGSALVGIITRQDLFQFMKV